MLGFVFAVILVFSYFVQKIIYPAPIQALLIAGAMVLLLFGMYPVPAMKGKFGRLSVAGPAALGLFIFLFVWKSLQVSTPQHGLIVLQDSTLRLADGSTLKLIDVDTFSDTNLTSTLDALKNSIQIDGYVDNEKKLQKKFFSELISSLGFGGSQTAAVALMESYDSPTSNLDNINNNWGELVEQASNIVGDNNRINFKKRVRREPFAIVQIRHGDTNELQLVRPGKPLVINGEKYDVLVIANPSLTVVRYIKEAIVIKPSDPQ